MENLKLAYQVVNDQIKLYAEFRWKAFYYLAALNAGMFILFLQKENPSFQIVIVFISILFTIVILRFEKRHRDLFEQSREVDINIEKEMFGELESANYGVFTAQISNKGKLSHERLITKTAIIILMFWLFNLINIFLKNKWT